MNQVLLSKMQTYPDVRILNTIKQANSFDPEIVEVAKYIANQKGIATPQKMEMLGRMDQFKRQATQQIQDGVQPEQIKANLMNLGLEEGMAKQVLTDAARSVTITEKVKKKESSGTSWLTIIFVVLFVIRMILRMIQNG